MKKHNESLDGIGARIREARCSKEISQQTLARYCGWTSQSRIANYESGHRYPSMLSATRIAQILCVKPSWLCFGKGEK